MKITWIGHSCFIIEEEGYKVLFDPYTDHHVPGYAPIKETADLVLCSHNHRDHNATNNVRRV